MQKLAQEIDKIWNGESLEISAIHEICERVNNGELRAAQKVNNVWKANDTVKKALLLLFRFMKEKVIHWGDASFWDKIPLKTAGWDDTAFKQAGFRSVPGSIIRYPSYIAPSVVLMPSFVNVGAYIGENSMVDSHALIGSCAQIGCRCHISDGVTIGGVLEPIQSTPVIVEDDCFIGAKCVLTEGVIVGSGSILAAGVVLSSSVRIINRDTGAVSYGVIPPNSVVVPGSYPSGSVHLSCAVIVKQVDANSRAKTSINEILRGE